MNSYRKYINAFAAGALAFGFLVALSVGARAQTNSDSRVRATLYGLHSLAAGQTARLSIVNRQPIFDGEIVPCIRVRVVFDIYEASPTAPTRMRFVRRVERAAELDAGEAASFEFTAARTGGERVSTAVFIQPEADNPPEAARIDAVPTLEVREGGRAILTLPGVRKGFDPQLDPPAQD